MRLTTFRAHAMLWMALVVSFYIGVACAATRDYASHATVDAAKSTAGSMATRHLPKRGETMAEVRARHGAPESIRGPVGRPAMSGWYYPAYHVYFEGNRVIHTVVPGHPAPLHHVGELKQGG